MVATLSLNVIRSAGKALVGRGSFGWFDNEVAFEVRGAPALLQHHEEALCRATRKRFLLLPCCHPHTIIIQCSVV